jgi:hypothetical protein
MGQAQSLRPPLVADGLGIAVATHFRPTVQDGRRINAGAHHAFNELANTLGESGRTGLHAAAAVDQKHDISDAFFRFRLSRDMALPLDFLCLIAQLLTTHPKG